MKRKNAILRIRFLFKEENEDCPPYPLTLLFFYNDSGDAFRQVKHFLWQEIKWKDEYELSKRTIFGIQSLGSCRSVFRWGGLKWCDEGNFQKYLNREGCRTKSDPDNPDPRKYPGDFPFTHDPEAEKKVVAMYETLLRHLK